MLGDVVDYDGVGRRLGDFDRSHTIDGYVVVSSGHVGDKERKNFGAFVSDMVVGWSVCVL